MFILVDHLDKQIRDAGILVVSVSVKDPADKTTWTVQPANLQEDVQPTIDAFDIDAEELASDWKDFRVARTALLASSDWTHVLDVPLTSEELGAWADYRQALRDLPANTSDPLAPVWPIAPL